MTVPVATSRVAAVESRATTSPRAVGVAPQVRPSHVGPAARPWAGRLRVGPAGEVPSGGIRSYLSDGRVVRWRPAAHGVWAIDAELSGRPVPPALAAATGIHRSADFWPAWTRAECAAKLLDVPILVWVRRHGLSPGPLRAAGLHLVVTEHAGITIALAGRATDPSPSRPAANPLPSGLCSARR